MAPTRPAALHFSGDPEADAFLAREPLALTIGFVLDQQVPAQKAFASPLELSRRLGGLDASRIAAMDVEELEQAFRAKPALHRFPASMARRVREHCAVIAGTYGGDAARVWSEAADGDDLRRRLEELPGFGATKVTTIAAVLAKRFGVEAAAGLVPPHASLGDVDSPQALLEYQAAKRARKAALRAQRS